MNLFTRTDTRAEVLEGDCLDRLREMEDESVHAVVTDPPAGISFMGAEWDSNKGSRNNWIAWLTEVMEEVLRVTKPGGHALVWALPRTSHWTAMALEDAGWEVRDRVTHHFGSGFPKSANVSKQIDKMGAKNISWFGPWLRKERERRGLTQKELAQHFPSKTGGFTGCVANWELGLNVPTVEQFNKLCEVLDLPFNRLEEAEREVIGSSTNALAPRWVENGQAGYKPEFDITAPATDEARKWDGWGTALKPSTEDWWLCRKPLSESSIARNVLEHSTGALNIGATRVGNDSIKSRKDGGFGSNFMDDEWKPEPLTPYKEHQGRWPANLIMSHHPDCQRVGEKRCHEACPCRILDEQSGQDKSRPQGRPSVGTQKPQGSTTFAGENSGIGYTDSGGASRYFQQFAGEQFHPDTGPGFLYKSKASRAERNKGLEGMPEKQLAGHNKWTDVDYRKGNGEVTNRGHANNHPTVKSVSLMRYLVRMVTPPEGTVLDCFAGSGSTLVAAIHEGFDCVGIEAEPEYAEICRARVRHALENPEL